MTHPFTQGIPEEMAIDAGAPGDEPIRRHLGATAAMVRTMLQRSSVTCFTVDGDLTCPAGYEWLIDLASRTRDQAQPLLDQDIVAGDERRLCVSCLPIRATGNAAVTGVRCYVDDADRARDARELILSSAVPIFVSHGPTHVLRIVNDPWRKITGYRGPTGVSLGQIFPRLAGHALPAQFTRAFQSGDDLEVTEVPLDPSGAGVARFYSVAVRPIRAGQAGAVSGLVAVGVDLTAQVLARQVLTDVIQTIIWSGADARGSVRFNRRWFDYTGLSTDSWQTALHADDLSACLTAFDQAARRRGASQVQGRLRRADGQYRWHRIRFTFLDAGGEEGRWFGIAYDVDDLKKAEAERDQLLTRELAARAEAETANRQKDYFLAALSHELRAPLGALMLWSRVLRDDPADPDLRRRAIEAVHECAVAQSRLVDDLLDVSRALSGKLHLDLRIIPIETVLQAALEAARPGALAKGLALDRMIDPMIDPILDPEVDKVVGDADRLRQVFGNLLSNAIKFTDAGGWVSMSTKRTDAAIEVTISDSGLGVAPEMLPRLFDAFRQDEESPGARAHGGLGLGLTIARQLVELHGGTLSGHSEGRGHGAAFTVSLPLARDARTLAAPSPSELRAGRLRDIRVLVVDDDPLVREPLIFLLGREGAHVEFASSAEAAWRALTLRPPDVILSDIAMPGADGDGYTFLRRVRADAPAPSRDIPAVALTAYARPADAERARAAGFDLHIPKPIDVVKLVAGIEDLVARRRRSTTIA